VEEILLGAGANGMAFVEGPRISVAFEGDVAVYFQGAPRRALSRNAESPAHDVLHKYARGLLVPSPSEWSRFTLPPSPPLPLPRLATAPLTSPCARFHPRARARALQPLHPGSCSWCVSPRTAAAAAPSVEYTVRVHSLRPERRVLIVTRIQTIP
jgi:hypothetical protein